jgi:hypothetical protein
MFITSLYDVLLEPNVPRMYNKNYSVHIPIW